MPADDTADGEDDAPATYPSVRQLQHCDEAQLEMLLLHLIRRMAGNQHRMLALSETSKRMLLRALIKSLDKLDANDAWAMPWRLLLW